MADNQLGVSKIVLPMSNNKETIDIHKALEEFSKSVIDNIDFLLFPKASSVSASATLTDTDKIVLCDATSGAITVTLPAAGTVNGMITTIKKIDAGANAVTVDGSGAETIDNSATYSLSSQYDYVTIYSDGTEWHIIGA